MWKLFFTVCDFLCNFIPDAARRERVRATHLYDWRKKYNALRAAYPELNFRHVKMIKGGWNIGFIVDKKYVFKFRKMFDAKKQIARITREKRITDAFASISPLRIPKIEIITSGEYTFFKYDFIPGRNMNKLPTGVIAAHAEKWGAQLAEFIHAVHNARPTEIDDLRDGDGDGWNHNDICNNILVDYKTMQITGLIDWEYAGWGKLDTELENTVIFSKHMKDSGILDVVKHKYAQISKNKK